jgi:hypothetical protein
MPSDVDIRDEARRTLVVAPFACLSDPAWQGVMHVTGSE